MHNVLFIILAVFTAVFAIYFLIKFVLYIKWEMHQSEIIDCLKWAITLGFASGICIYCLQ